MIWQRTVIGIALSFALTFTACETDQLTAPEPSFAGFIELTGLEGEIAGKEGQLYAKAFEVFVTGDSGEAAEKIPVSIWIDSGPGQTAVYDCFTDSAGRVNALYYLTIPYGNSTAIIKATCGQDTTAFTIDLYGSISPNHLSLALDKNVVESSPTQPATIDLKAKLTNSKNLPVPNQIINFTVVTGSDTTSLFALTNEEGAANTEFKLKRNWYGALKVRARLKDPLPASFHDMNEFWSRQVDWITRRRFTLCKEKVLYDERTIDVIRGDAKKAGAKPHVTSPDNVRSK